MARKMKDSGIEWIGKIPETWHITKIKYFYDCLDGERIPVDSAERVAGPYPYWGAGSITDYVDKYLFDEELILLGEDGAPFFDHTRPVAFLINEKVWVNNHMHVLRAKKNVNSRFLVHWLNNVDYKSYINGSILNKLTQSNMNSIAFAMPTLEEQERIANFLDTECERIDEIIEQTRASIEDYKKMEQLVITSAVTKGTRSNKKMKECQDRWISSIPDNWECKKFKYIATVKSNLVSPDEYADYPQVSPENIEKGTGKLLPCKTVAEVGVISGNHLFFEGQILYSKIRPKLNKVAIAPFDGLCSADMYPIETVLNKKFFVYALRSDTFLANIGLITEDRVKMPKINQEELANIYFAVPPEEEQVEIVAYLDEKTRELEALISKKEELLLELESYKKSLVFEYVTGKKEVPA